MTKQTHFCLDFFDQWNWQPTKWYLSNKTPPLCYNPISCRKLKVVSEKLKVHTRAGLSYLKLDNLTSMKLLSMFKIKLDQALVPKPTYNKVWCLKVTKTAEIAPTPFGGGRIIMRSSQQKALLLRRLSQCFLIWCVWQFGVWWQNATTRRSNCCCSFCGSSSVEDNKQPHVPEYQ